MFPNLGAALSRPQESHLLLLPCRLTASSCPHSIEHTSCVCQSNPGIYSNGIQHMTAGRGKHPLILCPSDNDARPTLAWYDASTNMRTSGASYLGSWKINEKTILQRLKVGGVIGQLSNEAAETPIANTPWFYERNWCGERDRLGMFQENEHVRGHWRATSYLLLLFAKSTIEDNISPYDHKSSWLLALVCFVLLWLVLAWPMSISKQGCLDCSTELCEW